MKASVLEAFGKPLAFKEVSEPMIGTGEVIVDVVAAPVLPYSDEVFSGARRYLLPTPVVPGCGAIGRVREVGPDATKLKPGDWVLCDPTVRSRDDALMPDSAPTGCRPSTASLSSANRSKPARRTAAFWAADLRLSYFPDPPFV